MATTRRRRLQPAKQPPPPRASRFAGRLAVVLSAAAMLVIGLILMVELTGGDEGGGADRNAAAPDGFLSGIPQDGQVLGDPGAPVTLVEYADFECPFCGEWGRTAFPEVVSRYVRDGRLRIEYRGLAFISEDSLEALRAALAAGEQDRLFQVMHTFFERQGAEGSGWVTDDLVRSAARAAGANVDELMDARDSDAVDDAIARAQSQAQADGVRETPSFRIGPTGGSLQPVALESLEFAGIQPAIEDALADAGA